MDTDNVTHTTITNLGISTHLETWLEAFLLDRKSQNMSSHTIQFYRAELQRFAGFAESQVITDVMQITPNTIRAFLAWLEETGHNPGGRHAAYRALKAFLRWFESEVEPDNWKNPVNKIKPPKLAQDVLEPAALEDIGALLKVCGADLLGARDRAIFLFLLDTGARANEALSVDVEDVDLVTGAVMIRMGKGRKSRTVFLGQKSRKALRAYLKGRRDNCAALFASDDGKRLAYGGLRGIVTRRASQAGIDPPELHSFRRAFAINMLRAGVDVYSLQELMGHADLQVLRRYLKLTSVDLRAAHVKGSPADNFKF